MFVVCYCIAIYHGSLFIGIISQINLTISKLISVVNYYINFGDCITKLIPAILYVLIKQ